jgi:hypothetical protein
MPRFCNSCGNELSPEWALCPRCGVPAPMAGRPYEPAGPYAGYAQPQWMAPQPTANPWGPPAASPRDAAIARQSPLRWVVVCFSALVLISVLLPVYSGGSMLIRGGRDFATFVFWAMAAIPALGAIVISLLGAARQQWAACLFLLMSGFVGAWVLRVFTGSHSTAFWVITVGGFLGAVLAFIAAVSAPQR